MNKNILEIIKAIVFSFILLLIFLLLTYIKKPLNIDLANIAGFYGEKNNSMDVVYIGGSACFVYWEPLKAWEDNGITSYSFSANTIQAELYEYLVKETIKHQDPEVIIIDARAFQYRDLDQKPSEVSYRNFLTGTPFSWDRFKFIEENVPKYLGDKTLSYHLDLIKYHGTGNITSPITAIKIITGNYKNRLKGFYFIPKVEKLVKYDFNTDIEISPSKETAQILDDLLEYLKTINKKVLFVVSPYLETMDHKKVFNYVENKVKLAGCDFLDANLYYDEMNLNFDTDFYNSSHVNIYGSEKYTEFLSEYLIKLYNINDRRNEKSYKEDWDKLLNDWHKSVGRTKITINNLIESRK